METRRKPQLLVRLTVFSVLFSQMLAWPLFEAPFLKKPFEGANVLDQAILTLDTDTSPSAFAENDRNARHAEEILTSDYKRLLGPLPAKRHVESFIGKRDSNNISEDNGTTKRHSDGIFTDLYSRHRKIIAMRNYLKKVLGDRLIEMKEQVGIRQIPTINEESISSQIEDMKEQSPECFQVNHLSNLKNGQDGRKELPAQDEDFRFGHFKADAE
ncbi:VIP peptides-like [Rhinolophus sinicus]|uniref:VIP peptides-like n=1 Tax=Rhinolophus sinicus TaxID=89399 RepID=UPI003D7A38FE